jgi:Domain of unknown function (DUF4395)
MFEKLKSYGLFQYGRVIPDLKIHGVPAPYPVLNERAIRAGAGMMFAGGMFAFYHAFYLSDFFWLQVFVSLFFVDFIMKVIVGTKFSPISQLANFIVRKQKPEYVGAVQKRFAWGIGLVLSSIMMLLVFMFEIRGPINLSICSLCLTFMFMESAFGICVGCKIYNALLKYGIIPQPEHKPACPGNVCSI